MVTYLNEILDLKDYLQTHNVEYRWQMADGMGWRLRNGWEDLRKVDNVLTAWRRQSAILGHTVAYVRGGWKDPNHPRYYTVLDNDGLPLLVWHDEDWIPAQLSRERADISRREGEIRQIDCLLGSPHALAPAQVRFQTMRRNQLIGEVANSRMREMVLQSMIP